MYAFAFELIGGRTEWPPILFAAEVLGEESSSDDVAAEEVLAEGAACYLAVVVAVDVAACFGGSVEEAYAAEELEWLFGFC